MMSGAMIGFIGGAVAALLAFLLFKDQKQRNTASALAFIIIFFAMKFYVLPYYYALTFETRIKETDPIFATIAKYYPNQFKEYVEWVKATYKSNESVPLSTDAQASGKLINDALMQTLPFASDKSIYNYLNATISLYKKLYLKNPSLISLLELPNRSGINVSFDELRYALTADDLSALTKAKKEVIESGALRRQEGYKLSINEKALENDFRDLFEILAKKYGSETISNTFVDTSKPIDNPIKSAQVIISMYEDIAAFGEEKAANMMKYLLMMSSK